jgi:allophanate hydrolase subunit 2
MDFDWKKLLGSVAPTLASALGGPLAGLAVKEIGDALGIDKPTQEAVTARLQGATADDLLKVKQADQAFKERMAELGVDLARLEQADRSSARELEKAGAKTPGVLSWVVVTSGSSRCTVGSIYARPAGRSR